MPTRRIFLKSLVGGCVGAAGFLSGAHGLLRLDAQAATLPLLNDYKALVAVFLYGGNDANNMIVPLDRHDSYAAARGALALGKSALLPLAPLGLNERYGLHPALAALHPLWESGRLAVLANVGTLAAPFETREAYLERRIPRPNQLFSHLDQQRAWETGNASVVMPSGWGGRLAGRSSVRESTVLSGSISLSGESLYSNGDTAGALVLPPAPTPLTGALTLMHPGDLYRDSTLRATLAAAKSGNSTLARAAADVMARAIVTGESLATDYSLATVFPETPLANQLLQVCKLINHAQTLGIRRQVFFCSIGGFDTHTGQGAEQGNQADLLKIVGDALAAFQAGLVEIGQADRVTAFTLSDFSRTLKPGGSGASVGSDHAWGGHHLIIGNPVAGGRFYGRFPDLTPNGPDDSDQGSAARGRWIPTTSVDQYAATLATWYGASAADLLTLFPNLKNFAEQNLGFFIDPGLR